jgi:predicted ester cyclase
MSAELNKAIVARFYEELWNKRNLSVADEIFAADCVTHQLQSGSASDGVPRSPEAVKRHVAEWLAGFPDLRFSVEQLLAQADHVVSRSVMHGTHTGVWLGLAPTRKQVSIRMFVDHRIVNGKIVEDWVLVEALGFFQQLEVVPATQEILSASRR